MPRKLADTIAAQSERQGVRQAGAADRSRSAEAAGNGLLPSWKASLSVLQVERKIRGRVKRQMEKTQREYYLNEQLKAIQSELGGGDGEDGDEIAELQEKIDKTQAFQGSQGQGADRAQEAQDHAADERRGDRGAQLSRCAARPAVGQEEPKLKKDIAQGAGGPRRRSLCARQGQGPDRRISRGAGAHQQAEGADPVPRRPAGRRQDQPRQVDCQGDRPRIRAPVARRRARRGRDPRPPPDLYRLAAGQDRDQPEEGRNVATRCSCSTRSTSSGRISAAIRRRRCSKCSIPNRIRSSRTIIWSSMSICRT